MSSLAVVAASVLIMNCALASDNLALPGLDSNASFSSIAIASPYNDARVRPLSLKPTSDERLIEPTSPILGSRLALLLKQEDRDPETVRADIERNDPELKRELALSVMAYINTLFPGTKAACQAGMANSVSPPEGWDLATEDAIPYQILDPLHDAYTQQVRTLEAKYRDASLESIQADAQSLAEQYRSYRMTCRGPENLEHLGEVLAEICQAPLAATTADFVDCVAFEQLNFEIMSPELAYPRVEFSINGFTRYVYGEIFKLNDLHGLLHSLLSAEKDWLALPRNWLGHPPTDFTTYVQKRVLADGYSPTELLLALSYSTRNMPSLDVEYGFDSEKALLLEIYFWQFNRIREDLKGKELRFAYPNHRFKEDPGVYHYMTAALQACELRDANYDSLLATGSASIQVLGYKTDKLISASDLGDFVHKGPGYLFKLAKDQGFKTGVEAGIFGGEFGSKLCAQ